MTNAGCLVSIGNAISCSVGSINPNAIGVV